MGQGGTPTEVPCHAQRHPRNRRPPCLQRWPCLGDGARQPPRGSWPSLGPSHPGSPGNHCLSCTPPGEADKISHCLQEYQADIGQALAEAHEMVLWYHTGYHIIEALGSASL